jgi:hypothetical protein
LQHVAGGRADESLHRLLRRKVTIGLARNTASTSSFIRTLGGTLFMALISFRPRVNGAIRFAHEEDTNASLLLQEV